MSIDSGRRSSKRTWDASNDPIIDYARKLARTDEDAFIQNFLYIQTKDPGLHKLRLNQAQREVSKVISLLEKQRRPIRLYILKSRQVGMSTYCAAKVFTRTYRNNNIRSMIIGHRQDRTEKLLQMCHLYYQQLPAKLQIPLLKSSTKQLAYANTNSSLSIVTGGSPHAARSSTNFIVHASEIAFYEDLLGMMGNLEQTVPYIPESLIFMETTAFGAGTPAHTFWDACGTYNKEGIIKPGDNAYLQVFLPWFDDPENQLPPFSSMQVKSAYMEAMFSEYSDLLERMKHYKLTVEQIGWYFQLLKFKAYGDELFMCQEYPCDAEEAWISSGTPIFPIQTLAQYRMKSREGYLYEPGKDFNKLSELQEDQDLDRDDDKYLEVWEPPHSNGRYLIGADGASGFTDGDYSSAFVVDRKTFRMCAELHGRFEPDEFAHVLASLGRTYNNAIVAPETNGVGLAVLAVLQNFYWRIYQWRMIDSYALKITNRLGWDTNISSRPIMVTEAKRIFKEQAKYPETMGMFLPSKALCDELRTFKVSGLSGKPQADSGCHDDRVMAWCITLICILQEEYGMVGGDGHGGPSGQRPGNLTPGSPQTSKGPDMKDVMDDVLSLDW